MVGMTEMKIKRRLSQARKMWCAARCVAIAPHLANTTTLGDFYFFPYQCLLFGHVNKNRLALVSGLVDVLWRAEDPPHRARVCQLACHGGVHAILIR